LGVLRDVLGSLGERRNRDGRPRFIRPYDIHGSELGVVPGYRIGYARDSVSHYIPNF